MERTPLKLLRLESLTPSRLVTLEKWGYVVEAGDCGSYYSPGGSADSFPTSGDPVEDGKLRDFMIKKQFQADKARMRRVERLRKLARLDLRLIGGVAPVGAYGGAGGGDGTFRPASIQPRT
jgi:hypothetical protein